MRFLWFTGTFIEWLEQWDEVGKKLFVIFFNGLTSSKLQCGAVHIRCKNWLPTQHCPNYVIPGEVVILWSNVIWQRCRIYVVPLHILKRVVLPPKMFVLLHNWTRRMSVARRRSRALCIGDQIRYCMNVYVHLRSFGFQLTMPTALKSKQPTRKIYGGFSHHTVV